tara:strand:- start:4135 stop:4794 length:660 start_codon:yes stop_codon:yes gene_type:complete
MAIDPATLSVLGLGSSVIGGTLKGVSAYKKAAGAMSTEEEERLRELERMEAIGMLGGDYNIAMGKQMTPVQGAMREAKDRMAQDISSQDISSGAYFRGQQAMETAAGKERSAAAERAQADMAQQEAMRKQEMDNLRNLKKIKDNAMLYGLEALGGEASELGPQLTQLALAREEQQALKDAYELKNKAFAKTFGASLKNTSQASKNFPTFKDYSFKGYSF